MIFFSFIDITQMTDSEIERARSVLSPRRQLEFLSRGFDEKALLSAAGDMLALDMAKKLPETPLFVERRENGAPYFVGSDLFISLSHSGSVVAAAIGDRPVGIDIEKLRYVDMKLAKRICTESETVKTPKELLTLWTLKEAYLKLFEEGISGGLKSVSFDIGDEVTCSDERVKAELIFCIEGYIGAVCEVIK